MTKTSENGSRQMAKAQKTMMVPEDLYELISAQERTKGITFTRQAIAAFLAYFFETPTRPDPLWIEAVIAVENDEIKIGDVPLWIARRRATKLDETIAKSKEELQKTPDNTGLRELIYYWECQKLGLQQDAKKWRVVSQMGKDDLVKGLTALWIDGGDISIPWPSLLPLLELPPERAS